MSQAQRNKKRFKLSMASMHDEISEKDIAALAAGLEGGGSSEYTWGFGMSDPLVGITRPKNRRGPRMGRGLKAMGDFEEADAAYAAMMVDISMKSGGGSRARSVKENDPSRSPILRIPLEVRERIYGYLVTYPKPIMVKHDFVTPERNAIVSHDIILVCKLFARECTAFLFRHNSIISLLRAPVHLVVRFEQPSVIPDTSLQFYRNITIDCARECYNSEWLEKATLGLKKLGEANASIKSLTLNFVPQRVGMTSTALGMELHPITFADFLWVEGEFMKAVVKLAPKILVVVIKKEGRMKLQIKIDLRYLRAGELGVGPLANLYTIRVAKKKARAVEAKLRGLKELYEEVFEDHRRALMEGRCGILMDDQNMAGTSVGLSRALSRSQSQSFGSEIESKAGDGQSFQPNCYENGQESEEDDLKS